MANEIPRAGLWLYRQARKSGLLSVGPIRRAYESVYAAYKRHYSLFPASEAVVQALGDELTPYLAGKGTIRFPATKPIPTAVVTKIVKVRVAENAARNAARRSWWWGSRRYYYYGCK